MSTTEPGPTSAGRTRPPDHAAGAAEAAVDRMRAARDTAKQRRAGAKAAVEQLRERNREECRGLVERARATRQGHQNPWPDNRPPQPRVLNLFEAEPDVEADDAARPSVAQRQTAPPTPPPQGPQPRAQQPHEARLYEQGQPPQDQEHRQPPQGQSRQPEPRRTTDDDWSQESWLH